MSDRLEKLQQVQARWLHGQEWPPGVHFNTTAHQDVKFLLGELERLRDGVQAGFDYLLYHDDTVRAEGVLRCVDMTNEELLSYGILPLEGSEP